MLAIIGGIFNVVALFGCIVFTLERIPAAISAGILPLEVGYYAIRRRPLLNPASRAARIYWQSSALFGAIAGISLMSATLILRKQELFVSLLTSPLFLIFFLYATSAAQVAITPLASIRRQQSEVAFGSIFFAVVLAALYFRRTSVTPLEATIAIVLGSATYTVLGLIIIPKRLRGLSDGMRLNAVDDEIRERRNSIFTTYGIFLSLDRYVDLSARLERVDRYHSEGWGRLNRSDSVAAEVLLEHVVSELESLSFDLQDRTSNNISDDSSSIVRLLDDEIQVVTNLIREAPQFRSASVNAIIQEARDQVEKISQRYLAGSHEAAAASATETLGMLKSVRQFLEADSKYSVDDTQVGESLQRLENALGVYEGVFRPAKEERSELNQLKKVRSELDARAPKTLSEIFDIVMAYDQIRSDIDRLSATLDGSARTVFTVISTDDFSVYVPKKVDHRRDGGLFVIFPIGKSGAVRVRSPSIHFDTEMVVHETPSDQQTIYPIGLSVTASGERSLTIQRADGAAVGEAIVRSTALRGTFIQDAAAAFAVCGGIATVVTAVLLKQPPQEAAIWSAGSGCLGVLLQGALRLLQTVMASPQGLRLQPWRTRRS